MRPAHPFPRMRWAALLWLAVWAPSYAAEFSSDDGANWSSLDDNQLAFYPVRRGAGPKAPHYLVATGLKLRSSAASPTTNRLKLTVSDVRGNSSTVTINLKTTKALASGTGGYVPASTGVVK